MVTILFLHYIPRRKTQQVHKVNLKCITAYQRSNFEGSAQVLWEGGSEMQEQGDFYARFAGMKSR